MKARTLFLWGLMSLGAGAQQAPPSIEVKRPTGLAVSDGRLLVTDPQMHRVYLLSPQDRKFELLIADAPFEAPTGVSADEWNFYFADPQARAVFQVNKATHEVKVLWSGDPLLEPTGVVLRPVYSFAKGAVERTNELLILDTGVKTIYRLSLEGPQSKLVPWGSRTFVEPTGLSRSGRRLLLADRGALALFENSGGNWVNLLNATRPDTELPSSYFPLFEGPRYVTYYNDIYYVADQSGVFAFLRQGARAVPLTYRSAPVESPAQIVVVGNKLAISDPGRGRVVFWPLLVPVTVQLEARKNTSEALTALYRFLWERGVLPTTEVKLPLMIGERRCLLPSCVVQERGLLPSGSIRAFDEMLCQDNPRTCQKGKWVLREGDTLKVPLVPFEKFLWVDHRKLDGKSSVRKLLEDWIPDAGLRERVTPDYLKKLNPQVKVADILSLREAETAVAIPVERHRYYVAVERDLLVETSSPFWELMRRFGELDFVSAEAKSAMASAGVVPEHANPARASEWQNDQANVLGLMDYQTGHAEQYGSGEDARVIVYETDIEKRHPVFFGADNAAAAAQNAFNEELAKPNVPLDGTTAEMLKRDNPQYPLWHGTCVSSLIGSRSAPYGHVVAGRSQLMQVASDLDLTLALQDQYENTPVVNLSVEEHTTIAEDSWKSFLRKPVSKGAFFVVAAGNGAKPFAEVSPIPAKLAREFSNLLSVGSLNAKGNDIADHSNWGPEVELLAPGEDVPCAVLLTENEAVYAKAPGTSMATALVSAVAALLVRKNLNPEQIKIRLLATAIPVPAKKAGTPIAYAGRLSTERALRDPNKLHFRFGAGDEYEAGTIIQPHLQVGLQRPEAVSPFGISAGAVRGIWRLNEHADDGEFLYQVAYINPNSGRFQIEPKVHLSGCLAYQSSQGQQKYLILFSAEEDCKAAPQWSAERIRRDVPRDFIGYGIFK